MQTDLEKELFKLSAKWLPRIMRGLTADAKCHQITQLLLKVHRMGEDTQSMREFTAKVP